MKRKTGSRTEFINGDDAFWYHVGQMPADNGSGNVRTRQPQRKRDTKGRKA